MYVKHAYHCLAQTKTLAIYLHHTDEKGGHFVSVGLEH